MPGLIATARRAARSAGLAALLVGLAVTVDADALQAQAASDRASARVSVTVPYRAVRIAAPAAAQPAGETRDLGLVCMLAPAAGRTALSAQRLLPAGPAPGDVQLAVVPADGDADVAARVSLDNRRVACSERAGMRLRVRDPQMPAGPSRRLAAGVYLVEIEPE